MHHGGVTNKRFWSDRSEKSQTFFSAQNLLAIISSLTKHKYINSNTYELKHQSVQHNETNSSHPFLHTGEPVHTVTRLMGFNTFHVH